MAKTDAELDAQETERLAEAADRALTALAVHVGCIAAENEGVPRLARAADRLITAGELVAASREDVMAWLSAAPLGAYTPRPL